MGAKSRGERLARMQRSPNYPATASSTTPTTTITASREAVVVDEAVAVRPGSETIRGAVPTSRLTSHFAAPPSSGLRATWLGHSTVLVEIDGLRVLFDPGWAKRASPSSLEGPKRFFDAPLPIDQMPDLDAVIASHDHYDHLDRGVVKALAKAQPTTRFFCSRSASERNLETWVSAPERITELDWWECRAARRADAHRDARATFLGTRV